MGHFGDPFLWFGSTGGSKGELLSEAGKSLFREKTNPSSSNHRSKYSTEHPLISHPRAKIRVFFPQTFQFNSFFSQTRTICHLTPLLGCGICSLRVMDGARSRQSP